MIRVHMTYDRVSPESTENGDFSDHGWAEPGGWRYSIADDRFIAREAEIGRSAALAEQTPEPMEYETAAEVIEAVAFDVGTCNESSCYPVCDPGNPRCQACTAWITSEATTDYVTGEEERISYHVDCDDPADHVAIVKALTR